MQSKMILTQIIGYSRMSSCKYCKNMENDHSSFDCRTGFDSGSNVSGSNVSVSSSNQDGSDLNTNTLPLMQSGTDSTAGYLYT